MQIGKIIGNVKYLHVFEHITIVAMNTRRILVISIAGLLASACTSVPFSESLSFFTPPDKSVATASPEPASGAAAPTVPPISVTEFDEADARETGELRFQPGDAVKVAIWGHPELDHVAVVQPNGNITVPLVGEVLAADGTPAQVRERVGEGLKPFTRVANPDLRPGDLLHFLVWHDDSLKYTAVIEPTGFATFPIIGSVRAVGRPVEDIRAEAEKKLAVYMRDPRVSILPQYASRRYLQDYSVSVLAQQLQPRRIAVIGEVGNPGLSELKSGERVVDALAQHNMRQGTAAFNSVVVIRNPSVGSPRYRLVRVGDYLEGRAPAENIVLRSGDIVIVPKTNIAKVGEFVELFFTRTYPILQWWQGAWESSVSRQGAETVRLINEALQRQLSDIAINPLPGAR